jgi:hypothetical protein
VNARVAGGTVRVALPRLPPMHGMLSLAVLVAAFAVVAAFAGYLLVRLYLACPAARSAAVQRAAGPVEPVEDTTPEPVA